MSILQSYIFRQVAGPFLVIVAGLAMVAIFTQGLAQLDVITDQRQSGLSFVWVTLLGVPLLMSLILPLALFFAVAFAINRMHSESELVVAQAGGVSNWQIASPVLKLATVAALAHLAINTVVQPAAYKEMRETLFQMRGDLAASLVRPGEFSQSTEKLVVYARERRGNGDLRDIVLVDRTNPARPTYYVAATGRIVSQNNQPSFFMNDGQIVLPKGENGEDVLEFTSYTFDLGPFLPVSGEVEFKPSDRTLGELFYPDLTYFYDQKNRDAFAAEGHHRLSGPLLNYAMALIALVGLLGGQFSRRGYGMRIAIAASAALLVRVLGLGIQAAAARDPALNIAQYVFPLLVCAIALAMLLSGRRRKSGNTPTPAQNARTLVPEPA